MQNKIKRRKKREINFNANYVHLAGEKLSKIIKVFDNYYDKRFFDLNYTLREPIFSPKC